MSRESKLFTVSNKADVSKKVKDYESFGWELLSVNGLDVSMSRNTQNPVYIHLVKYENEYETLTEEIEKEKKALARLNYNAMNPLLFLIGIACFLAPGILYYLYKTKEKTAYLENVKKAEEKLAELDVEVKKVTNDSRALFFSKRD